MQRLEVSGAVRLIYKSLGVKGSMWLVMGFSELGEEFAWRTERLDFAFDIDVLLGLRRLWEVSPSQTGVLFLVGSGKFWSHYQSFSLLRPYLQVCRKHLYTPTYARNESTSCPLTWIPIRVLAINQDSQGEVNTKEYTILTLWRLTTYIWVVPHR